MNIYVLGSIGIYSIVKAAEWICTEPKSIDTKIDRIRNGCFKWHQMIVQKMGERYYSIFRNEIVPLLIVAPLALLFLTKSEEIGIAIQIIFNNIIHLLFGILIAAIK